MNLRVSSDDSILFETFSNECVYKKIWDLNFFYVLYIYIYIYNIEQVLEAALHKVAAVRSSTTHHENYPN